MKLSYSFINSSGIVMCAGRRWFVEKARKNEWEEYKVYQLMDDLSLYPVFRGFKTVNLNLIAVPITLNSAEELCKRLLPILLRNNLNTGTVKWKLRREGRVKIHPEIELILRPSSCSDCPFHTATSRNMRIYCEAMRKWVRERGVCSPMTLDGLLNETNTERLEST